MKSTQITRYIVSIVAAILALLSLVHIIQMPWFDNVILALIAVTNGSVIRDNDK